MLYTFQELVHVYKDVTVRTLDYLNRGKVVYAYVDITV